MTAIFAATHTYSGRSGVRTGSLVRFAVADKGVGLRPNFEAPASASLGLELVTRFAEQLRAELAISSSNETRFELVFPPEAAPSS